LDSLGVIYRTELIRKMTGDNQVLQNFNEHLQMNGKIGTGIGEYHNNFNEI